MPHQTTLPLADWPKGFLHLPGRLPSAAQPALVGEVLALVDAAGLVSADHAPLWPADVGYHVQSRPLGWVTDRQGYRYQPTHPVTGLPWPPLPGTARLWGNVTGWPAPPEACLVNLYRGDARMGLHQDRDENDLAAPVISVSLGDDACSASAAPAAGPDPAARS